MAAGHTILRVKRRATDALEENLLVEGLRIRPRKKTQLLDELSNMSLANQDRGRTQQAFRHLATLTADGPEWANPQAVLAGYLRQPTAGAPLRSQPSPDQGELPHAQSMDGQAAGGMQDQQIHVYDVSRPAQSAGLNTWQDPWIATPAAPLQDGAQAGQAAAGLGQAPAEAPADAFVYDIYALSGPGGSAGADASAALAAPLVQVAEDFDFFLEDQEDSVYESEDSNAEGHYTHDYPDEDDYNEDNDAASSERRSSNGEGSRRSGSDDSDTW